jgi:hypothetical protein
MNESTPQISPPSDEKPSTPTVPKQVNTKNPNAPKKQYVQSEGRKKGNPPNNNPNKQNKNPKYRPKSQLKGKGPSQENIQNANSRFPVSEFVYSLSELRKIGEKEKCKIKPSDLNTLFCYDGKPNLYEIKLEQNARRQTKEKKFNVAQR